MVDGQFAIREGNFAIIFLGLRESAFDSGAQLRLLDALYDSFDAIAARRGEPLRLEAAGANRFAVAAEQSMKRDVYAIGACSFLGVATLFLLFVGGWRAFLIVAVPPLAGILVATASCLALLGELDGLTMAFGASLMGIGINYPIHLLIHNRLCPEPEAPARTAQRIRPSLALGAATTIASFGGLALTAFPAFREMSLFAAVGLGTAVLVSVWLVPALIPLIPPLPRRSAIVAESLGRRLIALERVPRALLFAPLFGVAVAPLAFAKLAWDDDMSELASFPVALVEESQRVHERVATVDSSRFAIGVAPDAARALELNDRIAAQIAHAVEAHELDGSRSLHSLLWSESLQRRNWELVARDPTLYARLDAAFAAEGFRPGAFREFGELLAAPPPPPLRLADLEASPLADLLAPFVFPLGGEVAVLTYLRDIASPDTLRARLEALDGVYMLDQGSFVDDIYREFRVTTLERVGVGAVFVLAILALRYRRWRPVFAVFLPSLTVALLVPSIFALLGVRANLMHALSLIMVMGMGDDYGISLVDNAHDRRALGAAMLSVLLACLTTAFVFGALAISSQPALRAIGVTTGIGILLSYMLAPLTIAALGIGASAART